MVHHVFTRAALYEMVWAEAMTKVAKRLGVSDVGLAKACRKADIPVPERGYWAKLQSGKPVQKQALPERPGPDQVILAPAKPRPKPDLSAPTPDREIPVVRAPRDLREAHPIIQGWLDSDARLGRGFGRFDFGPRDGAYSTPVAKRRLRLLSGLFKALEALGYRIEATQILRHPVRVLKSHEIQEFRIFERSRIEKRPATEEERRLEPDRKVQRVSITTNELVLKFRSWPLFDRELSDRTGPLEDQLGVAVALLEDGFEKLLEQRREQLEAQRRQEEDQARRRRREDQLAARDERRGRLFADVDRWRAADALRAMIEAAERSERGRDPEFAAWKAWALEEAQAADPVASGKLDLSLLPPLDADLRR